MNLGAKSLLNLLMAFSMAISTPVAANTTIFGTPRAYCETVFIQIARDIDQQKGLQFHQKALRKLGGFLTLRKKVEFDPYVFISAKAFFDLKIQSGEKITAEDLSSPEAFLAYIELKTQINGHDITQLLDLHLNNPRAFKKIFNQAASVDIPKKGISHGRLQNLFSRIYWATHHVQYPQLIDFKTIGGFLPTGFRIEEKLEIQNKLEHLIQLRAEYAVGRHGVKEAFADLGILKKSTLTIWNMDDLIQRTFTHLNPVWEAIMWAPKMLTHIMLGINYNHFAHRLFTSPAFNFDGPEFAKKLLEEGLPAIDKKSFVLPIAYRLMLYAESGLERIKEVSMVFLMAFFYYITAYALNTMAINYGYMDHMYVGALTQIHLFWDPIYGDYSISKDIWNFMTPLLSGCDGAPCSETFMLEKYGAEFYAKVEQFVPCGKECVPELMKVIYNELYFELPKMFPEDQPALRKLVMDHVYAQLTSCLPDCTTEQFHAIFTEIPVKFAEDMTEFDRVLMVEQLNSVATPHAGSSF